MLYRLRADHVRLSRTPHSLRYYSFPCMFRAQSEYGSPFQKRLILAAGEKYSCRLARKVENRRNGTFLVWRPIVTTHRHLFEPWLGKILTRVNGEWQKTPLSVAAILSCYGRRSNISVYCAHGRTLHFPPIAPWTVAYRTCGLGGVRTRRLKKKSIDGKGELWCSIEDQHPSH